MIEEGSTVKFNGEVTAIETGKFNVEVKEFFIDEQWRRFVTPKVIEVATTDYDNHLTPSELTFISNSIERLIKTVSLEDCDRAAADSIMKKLKS